MRKRPQFVLIASSIALLLAIVLGTRFEHFYIVAKRFSSVHQGTPLNKVIALLGKPAEIARDCNNIALTAQGAHCALEYDYSHPFAPVLPEYYVVLFDQHGRVIDSYRTSSP